MLGLTLEGGGAKGAYQIGAWKAFRELGVEFGGITGTSVGALNAALMIQDEFDLAYDIWYNMEPNRVFDIDESIYDAIIDNRFDSGDLNIIYKQIVKVIKGLGLDTKPLEQLVRKHLKEEAIRSSPKDFGLVTVCLTDRKPLQLYKEDIPYGKMADYLLASSCLPIFKNKKIDGKNFLDGGFYNNLPVDMLYEKGYRDIIAIRLHSQGRIKKFKYKDLNINYIQSHRDLGRVLDFTKKNARKNLKIGYFDTLRFFQGLKGREYYLIGNIEDRDALRYFMTLNKKTIQSLAELFAVPQYVSLNRALLECIMPKLFLLFDLDEQATYSDLVCILIEKMAIRKKINPFEVYSLRELVEMVENKSFNYESSQIKTLKKLKGDKINSRNKDKLTKAVIDILFESESYIRF